MKSDEIFTFQTARGGKRARTGGTEAASRVLPKYGTQSIIETNTAHTARSGGAANHATERNGGGTYAKNCGRNGTSSAGNI
ncbi:MAG TPA: hypothetical protein VFH95_09845 [Candidatus Kapabacteria bacterium]|nr:hypothetical protein [Candidatus Kapabacteria bacterium]